MSLIKLLFLSSLIVFSGLCGFILSQEQKSFQNSELNILLTQPALNTETLNLLKSIKAKKIENILTWNTDDGTSYFGYVQQFNGSCKIEDVMLDSCQKLFIYDESGKLIFVKSDVALSFKIISLTKDSFQILMTTNGGGTDIFLEIVEYKNKKFTEIVDDVNGQQMRGGWWMMPEYRSNNDAPYFKPQQIIAIQQQGGADKNPDAAILRYKNNKFILAGKIKMQELGDFIESRLTSNRK